MRNKIEILLSEYSEFSKICKVTFVNCKLLTKGKTKENGGFKKYLNRKNCEKKRGCANRK